MIISGNLQTFFMFEQFSQESITSTDTDFIDSFSCSSISNTWTDEGWLCSDSVKQSNSPHWSPTRFLFTPSPTGSVSWTASQLLNGTRRELRKVTQQGRVVLDVRKHYSVGSDGLGLYPQFYTEFWWSHTQNKKQELRWRWLKSD